MCSKGYGSCRVCVCVCPQHLTSGASVHPENTAKYSAGNEGQKNCDVFSDTYAFQRLSTPSLGGPYIQLAIFLLRTHMRIVHTQAPRLNNDNMMLSS